MVCLANVVSDCSVSATDSSVPDAEMEMVDQPFAVSESMDADLLPELSGETWVASALIEEFTADLITASRQDATLVTVRGGFSQNPLQHGRIVLDFLRNCAVGG